jgi:hypothetical protein
MRCSACNVLTTVDAGLLELCLEYRPDRARYVGWPGERYVLLHSLSHALIHELALECGYSAASIRERLYARDPGHPAGPMAGVLLYTSAPDGLGTLGRLVALADPYEMGRLLEAALARVALCSADPMCAGHAPADRLRR